MKVLFICTHNRCRSILSEAITNHLANGKVTAYSAGSQPAGQVHPLSLKYLTEKGISTEGLQSQSWDEFEAVEPDIVITVCDSAANEQCPLWFGDTVKVHWGLRDPSKLEGSEEEIRRAFFEVMQAIETRIQKLLTINFSESTPEQLQAALELIHQQEA